MNNASYIKHTSKALLCTLLIASSGTVHSAPKDQTRVAPLAGAGLLFGLSALVSGGYAAYKYLYPIKPLQYSVDETMELDLIHNMKHDTGFMSQVENINDVLGLNGYAQEDLYPQYIARCYNRLLEHFIQIQKGRKKLVNKNVVTYLHLKINDLFAHYGFCIKHTSNHERDAIMSQDLVPFLQVFVANSKEIQRFILNPTTESIKITSCPTNFYESSSTVQISMKEPASSTTLKNMHGDILSNIEAIAIFNNILQKYFQKSKDN